MGGGTQIYWCTHAWANAWKVFFFSRMCNTGFTFNCLKTLIFKKKECIFKCFKFNLTWNSTKSLFRGVFLKKAKTCLGYFWNLYVHACVHQHIPPPCMFTSVSMKSPSLSAYSSTLNYLQTLHWCHFFFEKKV